MREKLWEANEQIQTHYRANLLTHFSGKRVHPYQLRIPTPFWRKLASEFPEVGDTILELGHAVVQAEVSRYSNPLPETENYRSLFFSFSGEREGHYLMADILAHRMRNSEMLPITLVQEAHTILVEYGLPNGLLTPPSSSPLNISSVLTKVLEGQIKLSQQITR